MEVRMRVNGCPGTLRVESDEIGLRHIGWYCDCDINAYSSGWMPPTAPFIFDVFDYIFGPEFGGSKAFPNCDCNYQRIRQNSRLQRRETYRRKT